MQVRRKNFVTNMCILYSVSTEYTAVLNILYKYRVTELHVA